MNSVIFDMDGVIFDSESLVYAGWKALSEKYGFEDPIVPYRRSVGTNAAASREAYLSYYGPDFPYDTYKAEASAEFHRQCDGGNLPLKPGAREILSLLQKKGIQMALASSTRTDIVRMELQEAGLLSFFCGIIGGDQVTHSKPAPDIFLLAAKLLPDKAEDIYVIEDSFNGIRAASAAGMRPLMVPDMLPPDAEMKEKAEAILPDLFAAAEYLEQHLLPSDGADK